MSSWGRKTYRVMAFRSNPVKISVISHLTNLFCLAFSVLGSKSFFELSSRIIYNIKIITPFGYPRLPKHSRVLRPRTAMPFSAMGSLVIGPHANVKISRNSWGLVAVIRHFVTMKIVKIAGNCKCFAVAKQVFIHETRARTIVTMVTTRARKIII